MTEAQNTTAAASLRSAFAGNPEAGAGQHSRVGASAQTSALRVSFEMLVRYLRCLRKHKSGSIVSVSQWKGDKPCASVRYRCAGCGLYWSPRWRR